MNLAASKKSCSLAFQIYFLLLFFLVTVDAGRVQQVLDTTYVTSGHHTVLTCVPPASNQVLTWKFHQNGTNALVTDVAHNYLGTIEIFNQFNFPPGRTTLTRGTLNITGVRVEDEGLYWCEIKGSNTPSLVSGKYPLHVYVKPQDPTVTPIKGYTVQEGTMVAVAECRSTKGKPGANLSWWNGSVPLVVSSPLVVAKNKFEDHLWDSSLKLTVNWTRFDHRRNFTCLIEHPSYTGEAKRLNHSVNILYHPVNARIWANLTTLTVYCEADGYKPPIYSWILPGGTEEYNSSTLQMPDLFSLPGDEYFQCTADNNVPHPAVVKAYVDDLRYPDGSELVTNKVNDFTWTFKLWKLVTKVFGMKE